MQVIDTIAAVRKALDGERAGGRRVGLVPTMGFLHDGHASLMAAAAAECDVVAVTVFVNPLQFAAGEDLGSYPSDLDGDIRMAEAHGVSYVFAPNVREMYPRPVLTSVRVAEISEPLDGRSRPGHFDGVATVVAKLFAIAGPCRAYFGEKDFQQLAVVRRMASDLSLPVDVIGCPTVRAADGLALSSRNAYLTPAERAVAPTLHRALQAGRALIEEAGERDPAAIRYAMAAVVATEPLFELDFAEVVNAGDLTVPPVLAGEVRLLIAAHLGRARLIDNTGATA